MNKRPNSNVWRNVYGLWHTQNGYQIKCIDLFESLHHLWHVQASFMCIYWDNKHGLAPKRSQAWLKEDPTSEPDGHCAH